MAEEFLSLFDALDDDQLNILRPLIENVECKAEEEVFRQGEKAEHLYLVVEGEVVIHFNPKEEAALTISELGKGDLFGWSAALGRCTYTSGAICAKNGKLLRIKGDDLKKLYREYPEMGILIVDRLSRVIANRLTNTQDKVAELLNQGLQG
ncbi:MAG: hypothetical protein MAG431_00553 [Chloroflexi bacterium]|nr:hypothetical protein [Chloroflexota bacterium]